MQLPTLKSLFCRKRRTLNEAQYALEVFSGSATLSLSLIASGMSVLRPWDVAYDPDTDVLVQGDIVIHAIRSRWIRYGHFGLPCQSFTWARTPPIRSFQYPEGLPCVCVSDKEKADFGAQLFDWTCHAITELWNADALFTLENPCPSWTFIQSALQHVLSLNHVILSVLKYSDFGCAWSKPTGIVHNVVGPGKVWAWQCVAMTWFIVFPKFIFVYLFLVHPGC